MRKAGMRIGILGTRGIPNRYGGFEQCAEFLALGLAARGHEVWVYNAHNHEWQENKWNGINIIHCNDPEARMGTAGQFIYDLNCILDSRKRRFDILLQLGYTSNSIWFALWPKNSRNIVNMDGLEWKRSKYNRYVQQFLKVAEKWAATHADHLIADSIGIQNYLKNTYGKSSTFIPYGAEIFSTPDSKILEKYQLIAYNYHLLIARMEPENNIEMIIKGVIASKSNVPLIVVGKTDNGFGTYLKDAYEKFSNIIFLGGIYDTEIINNLRYYSLIYFHGHSVGGTNPSLLEAMGCSALIAAHDNVFNQTVLGNDAFYFSNAEAVSTLITDISDKTNFTEKLSNNLEKIDTKYNWESIVTAYELVFLSVD